ncbi:MAG TPA: TA system VapC family ribonuclease toxin [Nocardioidaceae bacterium]|nr:TA system VapC family ribonuclease toxin [Nocardioidaceae bacterium]
MLIDANLLLFARDVESPFHEAASSWLTEQLNGPVRVGLPWQSLTAFVRIVTHPRASDRPMAPGEAWHQVRAWLAAEPAWVPTPTNRHEEVLGGLIDRHRPRGNLVMDAHLAALALEHGLELCSADTDFARFTEIRWRNPLAV